MLYFVVSFLFLSVLFFSKMLWKLSILLYFLVPCLFRCVLFFFKIFDKFNIMYFFVFCLFCFVLFVFICWLLQEVSGVEEKPMSNKNAPEPVYDVFVSFRGGDVRYGFLSHLKDIFQRNKINAFMDDKIKKGDEIWPSLVEAIEQSFISLIIFSKGYASSRWCLEELKTILEYNEKYGRIVIPVFHHVEPAHVRYQTGSYKKAFKKHQRRYKNKVQIWRHALEKSANFSGIESSKIRNEVELLQEIVRLVLKRLGKSPINSKVLIGIDEKVAQVESLIRKNPKDTCLIGIWGMAGNGKTTLAEEVFKKLQSEYDGCYFLANEREQSSRNGIDSLKKEIFSGLLANVVEIHNIIAFPTDIDRRIGRMKVLIVLDDVNDPGHLEKLLGTLDNFGLGSRIIITTRYVQVLNANKANEIYRVGDFNSDKALELFNLNAFKQCDHQPEYNKLARRVVDYAKGNALVLKVLAQLLCGKNKEEWEGLLETLQRKPPKDVYEAMRPSYDGLDCEEQHIFLDLACFFLRSHTMVNVSDLKSLLKGNEGGKSVIYRLGRLKDKALINYSEGNIVSMHDSLQEMGLEIARQESGKNPGSHRWLWDHIDIFETLKSTETIRSILIHFPTFIKQELSPQIFATMHRLQFLEISGKCEEDCSGQHNIYILAEGLEFLPTELRFLCWYYYPLKSLPENFSAEKLVILKLPNGEIKTLWHGVKNLVNLKELNLTDSKMLEELPDLSYATNLEVLVLKGCSMLTTVHPSIFSLSKLEKLNLQDCTSLTTLASDIPLSSLSYLNLDNCEKLRKLSLITENMTELRLRWTEVKAFSFTFGDQSKLQLLLLEGSIIKRLPSSLKDLMQLSHLNVSSCRKLEEIPELPPSLRILEARKCSSLTTIEELPPLLRTLRLGECRSLQTLPKLPRSLKTLTAQNCTSLKTILFPSTAAEQHKENRKRVLLWNCFKLDEQSLVDIALNAKINLMKFANKHLSAPNHDDVENYKDYDKKYHSYQVVYVYPGTSVPKWLEYKTRKNYINIDLSSASPYPPEGFIFCFALGEYGDTTSERFEANITISDGEGKNDSVGMYIGLWNGPIESDHLCLMYDQRCSAFLNSRAKNKKVVEIKVTMVLRSSSKETSIVPQQMFKGFGISLINKQQME